MKIKHYDHTAQVRIHVEIDDVPDERRHWGQVVFKPEGVRLDYNTDGKLLCAIVTGPRRLQNGKLSVKSAGQNRYYARNGVLHGDYDRYPVPEWLDTLAKLFEIESVKVKLLKELDD